MVIPGLGDVLENEKIGASFTMNDPVQLAQKIETMLANPQDLERMGIRGREFVLRRHAWGSIVARIGACINAAKG